MQIEVNESQNLMMIKEFQQQRWLIENFIFSDHIESQDDSKLPANSIVNFTINLLDKRGSINFTTGLI